MADPMLDKVRALIQRLAAEGLPHAARAADIELALLEEGHAGAFHRWTTSMVERLAQAAGLDPAVVWAPGPLPEAPTLRFLRGAWPDFHAADLPALMSALEQAAALRALAVDVLKAPRLFSDADRVEVAGKPHDQGYLLAQRVRSRLQIPSQPIHGLHALAGRELHVHVVHLPLETTRLQAVTLMSSEGAAAILNTRAEGRPLMHRRTLAHELAHALFDPLDGGLATVLDGSLDAGPDGSPVERRARAFAAELLVPQAGLDGCLGVPAQTRSLPVAVEWVRTVAGAFLAPPELVANHLVNRRYVDKAIREPLIAAVAGFDPPVDDPAQDWLQRRAREALDAELISASRARALLGRSVYDHDLVA